MIKIILITLVFFTGAVEAKVTNFASIKKIVKNSKIGVLLSDSFEEAGEVVVGEALAVTVVTPALTSVAISSAGALGATASTGTAIASLSGAAATSATLAYIGAGVAGAVGVTVASPAIVGGLIVAGVSSAIVGGIRWLIDD